MQLHHRSRGYVELKVLVRTIFTLVDIATVGSRVLDSATISNIAHNLKPDDAKNWHFDMSDRVDYLYRVTVVRLKSNM